MLLCAQFCWTSSVGDAVSLIRTSSKKKHVLHVLIFWFFYICFFQNVFSWCVDGFTNTAMSNTAIVHRNQRLGKIITCGSLQHAQQQFNAGPSHHHATPRYKPPPCITNDDSSAAALPTATGGRIAVWRSRTSQTMRSSLFGLVFVRNERFFDVTQMKIIAFTQLGNEETQSFWLENVGKWENICQDWAVVCFSSWACDMWPASFLTWQICRHKLRHDNSFMFSLLSVTLVRQMTLSEYRQSSTGSELLWHAPRRHCLKGATPAAAPMDPPGLCLAFFGCFFVSSCLISRRWSLWTRRRSTDSASPRVSAVLHWDGLTGPPLRPWSGEAWARTWSQEALGEGVVWTSASRCGPARPWRQVCVDAFWTPPLFEALSSCLHGRHLSLRSMETHGFGCFLCVSLCTVWAAQRGPPGQD